MLQNIVTKKGFFLLQRFVKTNIASNKHSTAATAKLLISPRTAGVYLCCSHVLLLLPAFAIAIGYCYVSAATAFGNGLTTLFMVIRLVW